MLKSAGASETHGELFDFAVAFLTHLEALPVMPLPINELWGFFYGWAALLGFRLNVRECIRCGHSRVASEGGLLIAERGGLVCSACRGAGIAGAPSFVPGTVAAFLQNQLPPSPLPPPQEQLRISRLLADYCRYHCDIRSELKSLNFLETVLLTT
jgi:recombinational DNA repair protein (RecF pathway)